MGTVEKTEDKSFELNIKYCHLPGFVVNTMCPKCQKPTQSDLGEDYLSYPTVGEPATVYFVCDEPCFMEWQEHVILRVSLEMAPNSSSK